LARKIPKIVKDIINNPPKAINFAYQKNISYSQMSIFRGCQYRWKLQYKDKKRKFTSSIFTVFGSAIHEVIQHYLDVMYDKSGVEADKIDLEELFQERYIAEYQKQYKANKNEHFSSAEEMREFFEDGVGILKWFAKKRSKYFSKKDTYLVGCEIPIIIPPNKMYSDVLYMGYLDVVTYHEPTETFKIIDIKTSTRSWNKSKKDDKNTRAQLILYKKYFSEQYNIPLDKIQIEFFILKRKVLDYDDEKLMSPHQAYRVQIFTPPSGKNSIKLAHSGVLEFIDEAFTYQGEIKEKEYPKSPSKWNCSFCAYSDDKELCGAGAHFK